MTDSIVKLIYRSFRHRTFLIVLWVVLWPIVIYGAMCAWDSMSNRVEDWLPEAFEETRHLEQFVDVFGSDELLMVSWHDCTLDDPRLDELKTRLMTPVMVDGHERLYFGSVITGTEVFNSLTSDPMNLERDAAIARLSGWLMSPSGDRTCAVLTVSAEGNENRHALIHRVWEAIDEAGLDAKNVHVAGPTIESVAIDNASSNGILILNAASVLVCFIITYLCMRKWGVALLVLTVAVFNEYMTMALVYFCGVPFDSVMLMAANLTFVITVSIGIHFINYYRDAMKTLEPQEAVLQGLQHAFLPSVLSASTTAVGLFSLIVSDLLPIARFGLLSGIAVTLATCTIMFYIPLYFTIWPVFSWQTPQTETPPAETENDEIAYSQKHGSSQSKRGYLGFVERFVFPVSSQWFPLVFAVLSLVAAVGLCGINNISASVGIRQFLTAKTKVINDYTFLENEIGPLIPIEILVHVEKDDDPRVMLKRLRVTDKIHGELSNFFPDAVVIGLKNFLPDLPPEQGGVRQMTANTAFRKELAAQRPGLSELGYFAEKDGQEYWRISIRTDAMKKTNYVAFLQSVKRIVEMVLDDEEINPNHQLQYIVTGGVPLSAKAQNQLISDMMNSFLLAFVLIAVSLSLLFKNLFAGFFAILPSVMPGIVVFGTMGWTGIPLEIGTALTACSALGISVDDTIHFVTWFSESARKGNSKHRAVLFAYRQCSLAMLQTTLVCSFGLLIFAWSSFIPMIRFGICMFTLLVLAYCFTMLFLPAVLSSPLGGFFYKKQ